MSIVLLKLPLTELIEVDEMGLLLTVKLCGMAGIFNTYTLWSAYRLRLMVIRIILWGGRNSLYKIT